MPRTAFENHRHDAVLFDLDGLLTSTTALHIACWREALDGVLAGTGQPPSSWSATTSRGSMASRAHDEGGDDAPPAAAGS